MRYIGMGERQAAACPPGGASSYEWRRHQRRQFGDSSGLLTWRALFQFVSLLLSCTLPFDHLHNAAKPHPHIRGNAGRCSGMCLL
eukprot:13864762-Heterocapsa_arctica.AAC.1